ncbi:helix-turn-helix domain-containing protein [Streptomyces sp. NPDC090075]|uniref:helix-turn-helix domain-containing protein n=1 Tax=Streptomyces sp. NPDC090075 TaxID=3365937 RepID=UPI00381B1D53
MDTENPSAPSCAQPRVAAKKHPNRGSGGGLIHEHTRHTSHFTVVGNDLAQHPDLSGLAIGIGTHIQSLPAGAKVDIKTLAERLKPPQKPARKAALPPVPQPSCAAPALLQQSLDLLVRLRRHDSRLLLSATDTEHLAPGVAAWLERDVSAADVARALTSDLPAEDLRRPAALLAHRLTDRLPPPPPPFRAPVATPSAPAKIQNCDGCDRGFRAPRPGLCPGCRTDLPKDT